MKLIDLVRAVRGYVLFEVSGGFKERFINLCAGNNINIFDVHYDGLLLNAKIPISNFHLLRKIVNKTGVRVKVKNRYGVPSFFSKNRKRIGVLAGVIFFCVYVVVMNCFIWCIDATGSVKFSDEQIYEAAISAGVQFGKCRFFLDEGEIARSIYKQFDDMLSWVTVNVRGSRLSVEVRDTVIPSTKAAEDKEPCNIVADFDGIIVSDETYSGVKVTSKGSAVKAGDLLISGVVENENLSAAYYKADGQFTALHRVSESVCVNYSEEKSKYTSVKRAIISDVFGNNSEKLFVDGCKNNNMFDLLFNYEIRKVMLPFKITIRYYSDTADCLLAKKQAYMLAVDMFSDKTYHKFKNTKVIASDIRIKNDENIISIESYHDCIDFIGISKSIVRENIKS